MYLTTLLLLMLGLCAGSFVNALVWRVHQTELRAKDSQLTAGKNLSIFTGRSQCPKCGHTLAARDLIPVLSWLFLRGKCRYCGRAISKQYPLVELTAGMVFALSYVFWPGPTEPVLIATWLLVSVGLLAFLVYDARWMLLPNRILYPTLAVAITGRAAYILFSEPDKLHALTQWVLAIAVTSGFFWLLYHISSGKWIGYGDVRLGLITGTVLATPGLGTLMIFAASLLGTLFVLPALIRGRQKMTSKLPFGPFLITATWLVLLFGQSIINRYLDLLP